MRRSLKVGDTVWLKTGAGLIPRVITKIEHDEIGIMIWCEGTGCFRRSWFLTAKQYARLSLTL